MQVAPKQIERQQLILKALGFYFANIDGVWGPQTIEAKKKFEASRLFAPGIPNNGMPFITGQQLPAGITLKRNAVDGPLLYHPLIDALLSSQPDVMPKPVETLPETAPEPISEAEAIAVKAQVQQKNKKQ